MWRRIEVLEARTVILPADRAAVPRSSPAAAARAAAGHGAAAVDLPVAAGPEVAAAAAGRVAARAGGGKPRISYRCVLMVSPITRRPERDRILEEVGSHTGLGSKLTDRGHQHIEESPAGQCRSGVTGTPPGLSKFLPARSGVASTGFLGFPDGQRIIDPGCGPSYTPPRKMVQQDLMAACLM